MWAARLTSHDQTFEIEGCGLSKFEFYDMRGVLNLYLRNCIETWKNSERWATYKYILKLTWNSKFYFQCTKFLPHHSFSFLQIKFSKIFIQ